VIDFIHIAYELGVCYLKGIGMRAKPLEAAQWLEIACSAGHPGAMATLGEMLLTGCTNEVPQDVETAIKLLEAAADLGEADAAIALGKVVLILLMISLIV
jgi:TPR repeat protein